MEGNVSKCIKTPQQGSQGIIGSNWLAVQLGHSRLHDIYYLPHGMILSVICTKS